MPDDLPLSEASELTAPEVTAAVGFRSVLARIEAGEREFPLPGSGHTGRRFAALQAVAEADLCTARLVEGHVDALAILAELGEPPPGPGERWGVWAAEPPGEGLTALRKDPAGQGGDGWVISGLKQFCSGAHSCTHALVTARAGDERRLFAVRVDGDDCRPVDGTWRAVGMAGSDTPDVRFTDVPARAVGDPEAYVRRPGFWHGGIGVAACWYGGAVAVSRVLREAAGRRAEPHTDAHLGAVDIQLQAAGALLDRAAAEIDADPLDIRGGAQLRAMRVRAFVESACAAVLDHVGRATGAGPLCHDAQHARTAADLAVYIRQHHAERDLAALGALLARPEDTR
ncbi:acyl-CoA dehydrogenase [Streptomyces spiroverticillatus]|uniref:Acyl-CoA dehydrogenase n=1 Tax=Streptomyces finlayi TaxID=67296 RepID=A0A919CBF5_9ACTN|nr:acyl-CoA dehydrogenase family protein [Streptomyces finlayi]GHA16305.1 acyl-CoA dehydrogenase [Streptomyces spiroverticillatus]GHC98611.1 acyl-CoA dehydrogenase [Streptomyces finlayi]